MEHGAVDAGTVHAMIAATSGRPLVPLVRVAAATPWHAKMPLDPDALGVCFPMTTTPPAAEAAGRAVRYPPIRERFRGPFHAPPRWGVSMREYLDRADDEVLAIGTISHATSGPSRTDSMRWISLRGSGTAGDRSSRPFRPLVPRKSRSRAA
jgi:4-hydroxy-2-oxoheptanedioate aldolase